MNTRLASLAAAAIGLVFATTAPDLHAGDSHPQVQPQAHAQASAAPCPTCPNSQSYYRDCPFVPAPYNLCRPTPPDVYRYGGPKDVKSACVYGYSSMRDDMFYRNYPVSRGR